MCVVYLIKYGFGFVQCLIVGSATKMSIISSQSSKINKLIFDYEKPKTYLSLMQKVGDHGKYQKKMLTVFMLNWFVTGIIMLSNVFLFRNKTYHCEHKGLLLYDDDCLAFVCSLPPTTWKQYQQSTSQNQFENIATFNNFQCEPYLVTFLAAAAPHIGAIFGFLSISFLADNFGRKLSLLVSWTICFIGSLLVVLGFHIIPVGIGLFLSGFGSDAANSVTFLFCCEVLSNEKRQKYSVIMQIFFTIGALVGTLLFSMVSEWKIIWSGLVIIPTLIELVMLFRHLQETPHFLLKKGLNEALKALNRIGMINLDRRETLEEEDIENVIDVQQIHQLKDVIVTPIDLCRFPSLTTKILISSLVSFAVYAMYYSPILVANSIGLDLSTITIIILASEFLVYFPTLLLITRLKRRRLGVILLLIVVLCSIILFEVGDTGTCGFCLQNTAEIVFMVIFRAAVSFFLFFFEIYITELFPARIRGLSYGITSAFGSLSSVLTPIVLNALYKSGIDGVFLFAITGFLACGGLALLPQTKGHPLKEEIEEVQMHKMMTSPGSRSFEEKKWISEYPQKKNKAKRIVQSGRL